MALASKDDIELFNHNPRAVSLVQPGHSRKYQHYFGGSLSEYGLTVSCGSSMYVVYLLDAADPLCPIKLRRQHIPLCYGFRFGGNDTAYRIERNTLQIIQPDRKRLEPEHPYPDYPDHFPQQQVVLRRHAYNPRKVDDAIMHSAFFGLAHVPDRTLTKVADQLDTYGDWDDVDLSGTTREQYLKENPSYMPLSQGIPDSACVFKQCPKHGVNGAMQTVGFHPGFPEEYETVMWGPGIDMVSLIFQLCRYCGTFYVSNQCT